MYTQQKLETLLYGKAIIFLSGRARTRKEVNDRLRRDLLRYIENGRVEEDVADLALKTVLGELELEGLLNDTEYSRLYVSQALMKKRPSSKVEIKMFLRRKGIDREVIDNVLNTYSADDEKHAITVLARKRIKDAEQLKDPKTFSKHKNYFIRRGFNHQLITEVLNSLI